MAQIALAVWMPAVALGIGTLMVGHWSPLPEPSTARDGTLSRGLRNLFAAEPKDGDSTASTWRLVHVLYGDCGCSKRVLDYLLDRERLKDAEEWLLVIHGDDATPDEETANEARDLGLRVHHLSQTALNETFEIMAAPLFLAVDPDSSIRFCGGYTDRKQGLAYHDVEVFAELLAGGTPAPIPVYGCGVAQSLQDSLDPLSLKY